MTIARREPTIGPSEVDVAELETARLVLPTEAPPPSTFPRLVDRRGGRLYYDLGARADTIHGKLRRLDGAFDGGSGVFFYRFEAELPDVSGNPRHWTPARPVVFWLSYDELEDAYRVMRAIQCAPSHAYLPILGEDEEGE